MIYPLHSLVSLINKTNRTSHSARWHFLAQFPYVSLLSISSASLNHHAIKSKIDAFMLFFESSYLGEHSPDPSPTRVLHDAFVVAQYSDLITTFKLCSLFCELSVDNIDPKSSVGLS